MQCDVGKGYLKTCFIQIPLSESQGLLWFLVKCVLGGRTGIVSVSFMKLVFEVEMNIERMTRSTELNFR